MSWLTNVFEGDKGHEKDKKDLQNLSGLVVQYEGEIDGLKKKNVALQEQMTKLEQQVDFWKREAWSKEEKVGVVGDPIVNFSGTKITNTFVKKNDETEIEKKDEKIDLDKIHDEDEDNITTKRATKKDLEKYKLALQKNKNIRKQLEEKVDELSKSLEEKNKNLSELITSNLLKSEQMTTSLTEKDKKIEELTNTVKSLQEYKGETEKIKFSIARYSFILYSNIK